MSASSTTFPSAGDPRPAADALRARLRSLESGGRLAVGERLVLAAECLRSRQPALGGELLAPLMLAEETNLAACELMGDLQVATGQAFKAEAAYRRALEADLRQPRILVKLAGLLQRIGRSSEARPLLHEAIAQKDDDPEAYLVLSNLHGALGETEASLLALELAMHAGPGRPEIGSNWVLRHAYLPDCDDVRLLQAGRAWARRYASRLPRLPPAALEPPAGRRLRVAFLSPDFRRHSVAYFFLPFVRHYDRAALEVFCYADSVIEDEVGAEIKTRADHWRPVAGRPDGEVAAQLRRDRIDLAVDLAGHFANPRFALHALHPAPLHVHHLGFCGTTGLDAFDARLTDPVIEPPGAAADAASAEPLVRLPGGLHAYDPFDRLPPVAPTPYLEKGYVTFGAFNALPKIGEPVLGAWLEILRRAPGARLLVKNTGLADPAARGRLGDWFGSRGIETSRIELSGPQQHRADHLTAFHRIDIHLDTFPYNGVTTTCEALWMGVPVLTLRGHCHRGRVGESLLRSAGETGWLADDVAGYVELAAAWSRQPARLAAERTVRRARVEASPLADGPRHAGLIGEALRGLAAGRAGG